MAPFRRTAQRRMRSYLLAGIVAGAVVFNVFVLHLLGGGVSVADYPGEGRHRCALRHAAAPPSRASSAPPLAPGCA